MTHDVNILIPTFLLATFATEYQVTITSTPTGRNVTLDGVTASTPATFWKTAGTYTVSAASPQFQGGGWRYTFASWNDSGARSHDIVVSGPTDLAVTFTTSVLLTVVSAHGNVVGDGWYDLGDTASLHANATAPGDAVTRYAFTGWSGDATGTSADVQVIMNGPKTVTASWATEYMLNVTSAHGTVTGAGWHRAGTVVNVTLGAIEVNDGGKTWQFVDWTGDATGTAATVTVTMNAAKSVTANWREKPGIFGTGATDMIVFSLLIIVIVVVILLILLMMRRKKSKQQQQAAPPMMPPPPPPMQQGAPPQQWPPQQPPMQGSP